MKALTSARRSHIANFIMPFPKLHQLDLRTSWSRERKHLSGHRMKNDQASQQASKQRCLRARSSHSTCIPKEPNLNQSLTPITENSSRSANHPWQRRKSLTYRSSRVEKIRHKRKDCYSRPSKSRSSPPPFCYNNHFPGHPDIYLPELIFFFFFLVVGGAGKCYSLYIIQSTTNEHKAPTYLFFFFFFSFFYGDFDE